MMSMSVSIVIPVHNQWELTKNCLSSLAASLPDQGVEIIVVDNASSDATEESCAALGEQLFGQRFRYHRMEQNRNFGPASNFGAQISRGEYVLFLNNDTLALPDCPHWLDALLQDFADYPGIAATGPVLLYPAKEPLGATVQHLGVFVSPTLKVGHLYEGIPASSNLTAKRRFFQIITAACMLMPRALFLRYGGFDERYINGFEDVDLCARLWADGYRMTVNPDARLYHLTSQTPGRHAHEVENSILFSSDNIQHVVPDWHAHLAKDNLELQLTEWQSLSPGMAPVQTSRLAPLLKSGNAAALCDALGTHPFWYDGYVRLAALLEKQEDFAGAHAVLLSLAQLRPIPEYLSFLLDSGRRMHDEQAGFFAVDNIFQYCISFEKYLNSAEALHVWARDLGLDALSGQFRHWLDTSEDFRTRTFLPFLRKMREMTKAMPPSPMMDWAYTLWRELVDLPQREKRRSLLPEPPGGPAFSVLMPIYNPKPEHVRAAVDSLLRQEWPHWELCMVDDASPDSEVRPLLHELVALDSRIRVEFREVNGHIAAATNTALDMARHEYIALMDQDDLLTSDALREVALAIRSHPSGELFYTDEDKILEDGTVCSPYFKNSAWDWELLMGQNMVNHLGVYRTERLRAIGGFRSEFPGAQDYDMLLRYTEGLDAAQLVHIPRVVYHWRAHAGSTAADIGAKSEVLGSALAALTEHLRRKGVEGTAELVPDTQFTRIRYALPQPLPLVSLVVDVGGDCPLAPSLAQALLKKAGYAKLEVLVLHDQEAEQKCRAQLERWAAGQRYARLLPLPRALSFSERANAAGAAARGSVLGFLGKCLVPLSHGWLVELVAHLVQPGVGAIGGKLLSQDGALHHLGHVPDAEGRLFSLFRGIPADDPGYFAWARLARTVSSVDPRCLFTHKRYFEEARGFRPSMGGAGAIDFCLRLGEKGLRTVATPFAEFLLLSGAEAAPSAGGGADWESGVFADDPLLQAQRQTRIVPCNPNLGVREGEWVLYWKEEPTVVPLPQSSKAVRRGPLSAPEGAMAKKRELYPGSGESSISLGHEEASQVHHEGGAPQGHSNRSMGAQVQIKTCTEILNELYEQNFVDENYYFSTYPDVKASGMSAWEHFVHYGAPEGRNPNPHFDMALYCKQFPGQDVRKDFMQHFTEVGYHSGVFYKKPATLSRTPGTDYEELGDAAVSQDEFKMIAWYLPQFHPFGENDLAWGKGFTEWTNVCKAQPQFPGHYQPRLPGALGFYDLRLEETLREQAALAAHAGLYGFCFHHYWFHGKKVMNTPLEHLRRNPDLNLRFCLHWANEPWTRRWDGGNQEIIIPQKHSPGDDMRFIEDIAWALRDERYIRVQGKPVLGVYRPELFPDMAATLDRWREYCAREGIGDIFLFLTQGFENNELLRVKYGFDALVEFPPLQLESPLHTKDYYKKNSSFMGQVCDYTEASSSFRGRSANPYTTPCFRGVMPSWDNSPRTEKSVIFLRSSPRAYGEWLSATMELARQDQHGLDKMIFINAWNEWAESAYLEPDARYGFANLNETAKALGRLPAHLPQVLFPFIPGDAGQLAWIRAVLRENYAAPFMRPVVLALSPVRTIGTFEGLAPLVVTSAEESTLSLRQQFGKIGFRNVVASLWAGEPGETIRARLEDVTPHLIVFSEGGKNASGGFASSPGASLALWYGQREPGQRIAETVCENQATSQTTPLKDLLAGAKSNKPDLSMLLLPETLEEDAVFLPAFLAQLDKLDLDVEVLLPASFYNESCQQLPFVKAVRGSSLEKYRAAAIRAATADFVWFFRPGQPFASGLLKSMLTALVREEILCARCYGKNDDCIPHILGGDTVAFEGNDVLRSAQAKGVPLLASPSHAIFRRSFLLGLPLNALCSQSDFVMFFALKAHQDQLVAVVPGFMAGDGSERPAEPS